MYLNVMQIGGSRML